MVPASGGLVEVYGLPCQFSRHDACAGTFVLGVATHRRQHSCGCTCHLVRCITEPSLFQPA